MINDNVPDDTDLAQCCSCLFVDYWDEIPRGRCPFTEDTLTECPNCGDVDNFADYDPAKAIIREQRIKAKAAEADRG